VLGNQGALDQNAPANRMCLDANSTQAHIWGGINQWDCSTTDVWQKWAFVYDGNGVYQLQNQGDGLCLDADQQNAGTGGTIMQWTCNSSDAFQQFYIANAGGDLLLQSVGASEQSGTSICVDANYYQQWNFGQIQQYPCNGSDTFQLWSYFTGYK
jgi:Ricin-type beta-trefoil lectin domain